MGPDIEWLGEKTGQNNRLIGSTLAMRIGSQRYALTVAIDHSGDPQAVRDIIQAVARHLLNTDTSTD
jgi:beta-lactamase class A